MGFEVWASGVKLAILGLQTLGSRLQAPGFGQTPSTAAAMIDEAVRYFNEERILLKLGGLSPAEFLREYEKRQKRGRKAAANI